MMQKGVVQKCPNQIMVKDIDTKTGRIQGYFSVFGNIDGDGDMIMPGAFRKTIQEGSRRIKHLWQHDPQKPLAVPKVSEDSYGLLFESTITPTSYGRDVILLYQDGVINEHSIGYEVIRSQQKNGYKELQELKLWEGSSVTWGSNERAIATAIKKLSDAERMKKLAVVDHALENGRYQNEEVFETLELYRKELKRYSSGLGAYEFTSEEEVIMNSINKVSIRLNNMFNNGGKKR